MGDYGTAGLITHKLATGNGFDAVLPKLIYTQLQISHLESIFAGTNT